MELQDDGVYTQQAVFNSDRADLAVQAAELLSREAPEEGVKSDPDKINPDDSFANFSWAGRAA